MNIDLKKVKFLILVLSIVLVNKSNAQFNNLVKDSVYSTILNEQRNLIVYLPNEYLSKKDTTIHYPVLYVLDGNSNYLSVSGMVQDLSETSRTYTIPKLIIVCISNTKRTRDLTPYPAAKSDFLSEQIAKETGGAENFIKCIQDEIIPYISNKYPVTPYKALIGHSFGGIFALNALAKHKEIFDDYIVIDPSTWYDDRKFANSVLDSVSKNDYKGKTVFLAIANTNNQTDTNKVKISKAVFSEHEKSILAFNKKIKMVKGNLVYHSKYYPEDNHSSVAVNAIYDGIRFLFKDVRFNVDAIIEPSYSPKRDIPAYFQKVSNKIKFPLKVSPEFLEMCDMRYFSRKDEKKRQELRELYKSLYPEKAATYINSNKTN